MTAGVDVIVGIMFSVWRNAQMSLTLYMLAGWFGLNWSFCEKKLPPPSKKTTSTFHEKNKTITELSWWKNKEERKGTKENLNVWIAYRTWTNWQSTWDCFSLSVWNTLKHRHEKHTSHIRLFSCERRDKAAHRKIHVIQGQLTGIQFHSVLGRVSKNTHFATAVHLKSYIVHKLPGQNSFEPTLLPPPHTVNSRISCLQFHLEERTFRWNSESLCHRTCLIWDFLNMNQKYQVCEQITLTFKFSFQTFFSPIFTEEDLVLLHYIFTIGWMINT